MAGILSIGWWVPAARRLAHEIAADHRLAPAAIARLGLISKTVPGEDDHPSTMGARATGQMAAPTRSRAAKGTRDAIDAAAEDAYWRDHFASRPYVTPGAGYGDYGPAYRHAVHSYVMYGGRAFEDMAPYLMRDWNRARGTSTLKWAQAKPAACDAWNRLHVRDDRATPERVGSIRR